MRKIKKPKIGQYVLATHWSDKDPNDPWQIGFVESILQTKGYTSFQVSGSKRWWRYVFSITTDEGKKLLGKDTYAE